MAADGGGIHYSLRFLNRRNVRHYDWKSVIAAEGRIAERAIKIKRTITNSFPAGCHSGHPFVLLDALRAAL